MVGRIAFARADEIPNARSAIAGIFADGFMHWLQFFSRDQARLARAFAHIFRLDCFYCALVDGQVAATAACTDGRPSVHLDGGELRRHLGFFKGTIAVTVLKSEFEKSDTSRSTGTGSIEFVGTARQFRRRGIATALLSHLIEATPYARYDLEVADTNRPAVELYEKLGFREERRKQYSARRAKRSGVNAILTLRYAQDGSPARPDHAFGG